MAERSPNGLKTLRKGEIAPFSTVFSKDLYCKYVKRRERVNLDQFEILSFSKVFSIYFTSLQLYVFCDSVWLVISVYLLLLPVAHLSDAPRRHLDVTGNSARIQDKLLRAPPGSLTCSAYSTSHRTSV